MLTQVQISEVLDIHNKTFLNKNIGLERRNYTEIYYLIEKKECDFVVMENGKAKEIIQVCYDLNADNLNREIDGLMEAMSFFETKEAKIITFNQTDTFNKDGKTIEVLPFHLFAL